MIELATIALLGVWLYLRRRNAAAETSAPPVRDDRPPDVPRIITPVPPRGMSEYPDIEELTGRALFWAHKTESGFELLGWCDNVAVCTVGDNTGYYFRNATIIDLTQQARFIVKDEIWLTPPEVKQIPRVAGGFHILYQFVERGFLSSGAAAYLWPADQTQSSEAIRDKIATDAAKRHKEGAKWTWQQILSKVPAFVVDLLNDGVGRAFENLVKRGAAGSLLYPRSTPSYHSIRSVPWSNFWRNCPWPVGVELSPEAMKFPVGDR